MSFGKNITSCKRCISAVPIRCVNTDIPNTTCTSTTEAVKMQAKNVVLNHWKLINQLKSYVAKFSEDKTFETAINKEFAQFLKKIEPRISGIDFIKYFTSSTALEPRNANTDKNDEQSTMITRPSVLDNIRNALASKTKQEPPKKVIPKWKLAKHLVIKDDINSRTSQILLSVLNAQSDSMRLVRIEDLIAHIKKYPDVKHNLVKEGAIRMLMLVRKQTKEDHVHAALREAFALLGYADPVPRKGIRILSIDGGGTRGVLVVEMLRKLEELSGTPVYEMFDIICGVSTGAIIGTLACLKQHTLDEVSDIYKTLSQQIFTQSALRGTSNLVWSQSYYDTELWEEMLQNQWDDRTLIETSRNKKCPKFCAVSAVVNQARLSAYLFRNYTLPCRVQSQYLGGHNHKVWQAVRASAAAPTYFEEFKLDNMIHQDGGILVNNPTAVAIHEAKLLWPSTPIQCVISFGTGRTAPNPVDANAEPTPLYNTSWKSKFFAIIDSATDTEGVHTMLSDLLPPDVYYRFNPYLTEMLDMTEINPKKIEQLERDALMYLRRNEDKFHQAVKALSQSKTVTQKVTDWFNVQKEIHGFKI